jgi:hypothetical protein
MHRAPDGDVMLRVGRGRQMREELTGIAKQSTASLAPVSRRRESQRVQSITGSSRPSIAGT